jgi:hypothetical protein
MHERIKNELSLDAARNVLASVGEVVGDGDRQLLYTVVAKSVQHAIEMYGVRMEWLRERHIATEVVP